MDSFLFIVRNGKSQQLYAGEHKVTIGLMQFAHELIDAFSRFGAERCEIWLRSEHHKMLLVGTAF